VSSIPKCRCRFAAERQDAAGTVFGAAADATLLARLDLKIGDRVTNRSERFNPQRVGSEPDKLAAALVSVHASWSASPGSAPPNCCNRQPGALENYRVKLPDNTATIAP